MLVSKSDAPFALLLSATNFTELFAAARCASPSIAQGPNVHDEIQCARGRTQITLASSSFSHSARISQIALFSAGFARIKFFTSRMSWLRNFQDMSFRTHRDTRAPHSRVMPITTPDRERTARDRLLATALSAQRSRTKEKHLAARKMDNFLAQGGRFRRASTCARCRAVRRGHPVCDLAARSRLCACELVSARDTRAREIESRCPRSD